jgi:hypothetical protein
MCFMRVAFLQFRGSIMLLQRHRAESARINQAGNGVQEKMVTLEEPSILPIRKGLTRSVQPDRFLAGSFLAGPPSIR